jgi:hypothetical protein
MIRSNCALQSTKLDSTREVAFIHDEVSLRQRKWITGRNGVGKIHRERERGRERGKGEGDENVGVCTRGNY